MEPLKEMFNMKFYRKLAMEFQNAHRQFNPDRFVKDVTTGLEHLSLNQRMRNTSVVLQKHLPGNYLSTIAIMMKVIGNMNKGYTALLFPDYVGLYGHEHFSASMEALKFFTSFGSSEFAVREFLKRDFTKTIKVMQQWSEDDEAHVRRLASEGSRPRLPWSFKLEEVIKNPGVTRPILENLKGDRELYVKKSVANHLNDISKDNPDHVLSMVRGWDKSNENTAWIIKRGCRSLLKQGDVTSLAVFDYTKKVKVEVKNLKLNSNILHLNEVLKFDFDLISQSSASQKLVLHYRIHYRKKSGGLSPKTFSLKECILPSKVVVKISKRQRFEDFTTRKHFDGQHILEILVNGKVLQSKKFMFTR